VEEVIKQPEPEIKLPGVKSEVKAKKKKNR
jgi:hypothetical protein